MSGGEVDRALNEMIDAYQGDIDEYGKGLFDLWDRLERDEGLFKLLCWSRGDR